MKKITLILITIFSLLIIKGENYQCKVNLDSFLNIENVMLSDYIFVQNGIKVEYTTKNNLTVEKNNIIEKLLQLDSLQVTQDYSSISAYDENNNYNITLYKEDKTRVEIVLINNNESLNIRDLKELINNIKSNDCIEERYFSFIKSKNNKNNQEISSGIMDEIEEDSVQSIDIINGNITKALLKDGTVINLGKMNYNTGEYLIIGTPVIFTTY